MDLQQLIEEATPGSIWMRTDGSRARVIAITNLSLPAESQQKYVPVVVYVGPSGKVFSRPLKDFAGYFPTWLGHNAEAESKIKSLLVPLNAAPAAPVETSEDDAIDMSDDEPVAVQAPRAKPVVQVREKVESKVAITAPAEPVAPPSLMRAAFLVGKDESRKTPAVSADQLSRALRVYSQVPDEHLGLVVHKLSFELSPNLTIDNLKEVFAPDEWVNTVDAFRIGTPVSDETVGVDAYIGVYPEFTRNVLYGTVYVGVDMVPVAPLQSHVHEEASQAETTPVDSSEQASVEPEPEKEAPVPLSDQVPPISDGIEANTVEDTADKNVQESATEVQEAVFDVPVADNSAQVTNDESSTGAAPEADKPVKKKRRPGRPKKSVDPVLPPMPDDEELDVDNLS